MQWNTQAGNITTYLKVNIDFTLPTLRAKNVVTWKCHADESSKGSYDMILGLYILTELGLNLKFSVSVIEVDNGPFKGSTTPMTDLGVYEFKKIKNRGNYT